MYQKCERKRLLWASLQSVTWHQTPPSTDWETDLQLMPLTTQKQKTSVLNASTEGFSAMFRLGRGRLVQTKTRQVYARKSEKYNFFYSIADIEICKIKFTVRIPLDERQVREDSQTVQIDRRWDWEKRICKQWNNRDQDFWMAMSRTNSFLNQSIILPGQVGAWRENEIALDRATNVSIGPESGGFKVAREFAHVSLELVAQRIGCE